MKKIFTLMTGLVLAVAVMAADHGADLTIRNSRNFKVVIDGRAFYGNSAILRINNLSRGYHRIEVFEMRRGRFGQRERLVTSTSFKMGKKDLRMNIDPNGRVHIMQDRDRDRYDRDRDWDDRSYNRRNDDYRRY